jgi:hypothetical protein
MKELTGYILIYLRLQLIPHRMHTRMPIPRQLRPAGPQPLIIAQLHRRLDPIRQLGPPRPELPVRAQLAWRPDRQLRVRCPQAWQLAHFFR